MRIAAIVAMSENRVIGKDNQLPWHLPADLKHFKQITMGKSILMGRKTFESIGHALPGRKNIIITRDAMYYAKDCLVFNSIDTALASLATEDEIFVIGGALLFQQMLPRIQHLYLTIIHQQFAGDVFFPEFDMQEWHEVKREDYEADALNQYSYSFIELESATNSRC